MNCHREIELLEYFLGNSEYDSVIAKEEVHYSGKEQKDIIRADDVEGRLTDSLESTLESYLDNFLKRLNQHTDVLIEEEKSEQHTKVLPKEEEALRPYVFYFNNCLMSAALVVDTRGNLSQMSSQVNMVEEDYVEEFNPWNRDVQLLERMLDSYDSMHKEIIMKRVRMKGK